MSIEKKNLEFNGELEKSSTDKFYQFQPPEILSGVLSRIDQLHAEINKKKTLKEDLWPTIQEKLAIDWTYDSNAIEGSTLTRSDTHFFLTEGLTVAGKPLKDFLDAQNHAEAIKLLYEIIENKRPIGESLIKELNALLLTGVTSTPAINQFGHKVQKPATPGEYKLLTNHVQKGDGSIHYYVDPLQVTPQMQELVAWVNQNMDQLHPIIVAAVAHYNMVRIHPFDDGNGRGARLLMNLILMKKELPPAIVKNEKRQQYLESLGTADKGNLDPFIFFITESLISTMEMIVSDLNIKPPAL